MMSMMTLKKMVGVRCGSVTAVNTRQDTRAVDARRLLQLFRHPLQPRQVDDHARAADTPERDECQTRHRPGAARQPGGALDAEHAEHAVHQPEPRLQEPEPDRSGSYDGGNRRQVQYRAKERLEADLAVDQQRQRQRAELAERHVERQIVGGDFQALPEQRVERYLAVVLDPEEVQTRAGPADASRRQRRASSHPRHVRPATALRCHHAQGDEPIKEQAAAGRRGSAGRQVGDRRRCGGQSLIAWLAEAGGLGTGAARRTASRAGPAVGVIQAA